jgi:hypothetical protein
MLWGLYRRLAQGVVQRTTGLMPQGYMSNWGWYASKRCCSWGVLAALLRFASAQGRPTKASISHGLAELAQCRSHVWCCIVLVSVCA